MKIAVLGTGVVGRTIAAGLAGLGQDVVVGTRDPRATLARTEPDAMGTAPFSQWHERTAKLTSYASPMPPPALTSSSTRPMAAAPSRRSQRLARRSSSARC